MVEAHKTATATFEKIAIALDSLDKFNRTVHTSGGRKPLSESRCVNSLKTLGSDKLEFKNWNENQCHVANLRHALEKIHETFEPET